MINIQKSEMHNKLSRAIHLITEVHNDQLIKSQAAADWESALCYSNMVQLNEALVILSEIRGMSKRGVITLEDPK